MNDLVDNDDDDDNNLLQYTNLHVRKAEGTIVPASSSSINTSIAKSALKIVFNKAHNHIKQIKDSRNAKSKHER